MPGLNKTISMLAAMRRAGAVNQSPMVLDRVSGFGPNPGGLTMLTHVPVTCPAKAPLVVVLHGCTQTAEGYARGAGWIAAADRFGFALLCPEQTSNNNPNMCFNWFVPGDIRRGSGEAASIAQMVTHMTHMHDLDAGQVYITGLSAGGAMANVMLATYPELFHAGAVVAGVSYASAGNVQEAFAAMAHQRDASDQVLGGRVRDATNGNSGRWPKITIWHGDQDTTVSPAAGDAIARQWINVHGALPDQSTRTGDRHHRSWKDAHGAVVVEHHAIRGMGHGTPLQTGQVDSVGTAGPYLLEVGISSTLEILKGWGLVSLQPSSQFTPHAARPAAEPKIVKPHPASRPGPIDIAAVIDNALRAAGLVK